MSAREKKSRATGEIVREEDEKNKKLSRSSVAIYVSYGEDKKVVK
jgi:hypothetical protein